MLSISLTRQPSRQPARFTEAAVVVKRFGAKGAVETQRARESALP